ncbi:MAG: diguanylate cyclase, partial [Holophaga sp.]|nr:diguanylate cyclase [Holophaga sp.]
MVRSPNIWNARILIVDDEQANALLLERILTDAGYTAITCTLNSSAVCGLHLEHHFDLILLDLQMPGMNGFQVMEELKILKLDDYLPVMVLTAHPAHKLKALKCGAKDFISKPFDLNEVLLRVHNMLEVRLLHRETQERGKRLESLVHNDPLTGLGNRRLLAERMSMAMAHARRKKRSMAVIYLDLDGFKQINDTLGHGVGDLLLVAVSDRLSSLVREEDTLVRLGGD